ncbi:MAG: hypothetical protein JWN67_437 [Actinomycetia bacterium]|nr:hypothetical protein [Actinomycetes bacterium]
MTGITAPARPGGRTQARAMLEGLPAELAGATIVIDFGQMDVVTPSFVDELVLIALAERNAAGLTLKNVPERAHALATRSAQARQVTDRIQIQLRAS